MTSYIYLLALGCICTDVKHKGRGVIVGGEVNLPSHACICSTCMYVSYYGIIYMYVPGLFAAPAPVLFHLTLILLSPSLPSDSLLQQSLQS